MTTKDLGAAAFANCVDLAQARLGGEVLYCTEDFFAGKDNLIQEGRGIFIADKYTEDGKWMDGWESRRKREEGYDYAILKLGASGIVSGLDIDTNHFLGNHPPFASVDACCIDGDPDVETLQNAEWTEILSQAGLKLGSQNLFAVHYSDRVTHLRLNIYPDGGVARFRAYGRVTPNWDEAGKDAPMDLAALLNGGEVLACNDMFFGAKDNMIMPGDGVNMGDGWETRRKRDPGYDWSVIKLGAPGTLKKVIIDTKHFKGNYPDHACLEGLYADKPLRFHAGEKHEWTPILGESQLSAHKPHVFEELLAAGPFTHLRLRIYPDGGISRLRAWGLRE